MAIKSAYREKPTPNIQELSEYLKPQPAGTPEEPPQPSETVRIDFTNGAEPVEAAAEPPQPVDEATQALLRQLAHLRASEEALKQHHAAAMAQQHAQPPTREQKLSMWIQQGLDEEDGRFLSEHPEMIDRHDLTRIASDEAEQQGHGRGTDSHRRATKENFDRHRARLQAQPAAAAEPSPTFFAPPSPAVSERPGPASYVSAPVSRHVAGSPREQSPSSTRLSPAEVEIARVAGVSDVEYARQKQRLAQEKAAGNYGERR